MKGLVEFIKEHQISHHAAPIKEKGLHKITIGDYLNGGYHDYEVNVVYAVNDENQLRKDEAVIIINDPKNKHKYQDFFLNKDEWMMLTVYDNDEDPKETWEDYNINLKVPDWFTKDKLMTSDELENALKKV